MLLSTPLRAELGAGFRAMHSPAHRKIALAPFTQPRSRRRTILTRAGEGSYRSSSPAGSSGQYRSAPAGSSGTYRSKPAGSSGRLSQSASETTLLEFKEARAVVHEEMLGSPAEYATWWNTCKGVVPGNVRSIPVAPNITYKYKGFVSWNDWLGISSVDAFAFWKAYLEQENPGATPAERELQINSLYSLTEKIHYATKIDKLDVAQQAEFISPIIGLDVFDALEAINQEPKLLDLSPSRVAMVVMALQTVLPTELDTTQMIKERPAILVQTDPMDGEHNARIAVEDLRALLPEACVVWLLRAKPELLMGIPETKLEKLGEASKANAERFEELRENVNKNAALDEKYFTWFELNILQKLFPTQQPKTSYASFVDELDEDGFTP